MRRWVPLILALLAPVGTLLPHALGAACWVYLPVHWVPLLGGLLLGLRGGLAIGAVAALGNLTLGGRGLAAVPTAVELLTYGAVAGALMDLLSRPRAAFGQAPRLRAPVRALLALSGAMLAGRITYLLIAALSGRPWQRTLVSLWVTPLPGILLQLALLPPLFAIAQRWMRAAERPPSTARS